MWLVIACSKATVERVSVHTDRRLGPDITLALFVVYPLTGINRERNLWLPASSAQEMEDSANFGR